MGLAFGAAQGLIPTGAAGLVNGAFVVGSTGYGVYDALENENNLGLALYRGGTGLAFGLYMRGYRINLGGAEEDGSYVLGANRVVRSPIEKAARGDMLDYDIENLDPNDRPFYSAPNANSLESLAPAKGYILSDAVSGEPLKYGMTTLGKARYSVAQLKAMNAELNFVAEGSVADMRAWETKQILDYVASTGERPPSNWSNH